MGAPAFALSPDHPVVVTNFVTGAKEIKIDGIASYGELVLCAISEHVETVRQADRTPEIRSWQKLFPDVSSLMIP